MESLSLDGDFFIGENLIMTVNLINSSRQTLGQLQYATSIASENINNAKNANYARQLVTFSSNGLGIVTANPVRMSNAYLNHQLNQSNSELNYAGAVYSMANSVDKIITGMSVSADGSTSNALQSGITDINASLINLITEDSDASRSSMLSRFQSLIDTSKTMSSQLDEFRQQLIGETNQISLEINEVSKQVAKLNEQLVRSPNDPHLLTQRDQLINKASDLANIEYTENANGTVELTIAGGYQLVKGSKTNPVTISEDEFGKTSVNILGVDISKSPEKLGGKLGASLISIEKTINEADRMLAKIVVGFAAELNKANSEGYLPDGTSGGDLITIPNANGVASSNNTGSATVSATIDPEKVSELTEGPITLTKTPSGYEFYDASTGKTEVATTLPAEVFGMKFETPTGTMQNGDSFEVDALSTMMAGMEVVGTAKDIAAASKLPVEAGDNGNLVNISKITSESIFGGKHNVVAELGNMFVNIGNHTVAAKGAMQTADSLKQTSLANWNNFSGVNIQEEELNMIQYQQVYQTVSKVINVAKESFDSLLNII